MGQEMCFAAQIILTTGSLVLCQSAAQDFASPQPPCQESQLQELVGEPYSEELAERARQLSGATFTALGGLGNLSSSDSRPERLNIFVDAARVVIDFQCG